MFSWQQLSSMAPDRPPFRHILVAGLGGFMAIMLLLLLQDALQSMWLMASFGASCFIVFGLPDSPLAQPRNVIFGHLISAATGLCVAQWLGVNAISMALAVGLAIGLMLWTRTSHPPAGANPLIVMLSNGSWSFLVFPVAVGALALIVVACLIHRLNRQAYPKYWW